jgi:peptidylprolyl isomerase
MFCRIARTRTTRSQLRRYLSSSPSPPPSPPKYSSTAKAIYGVGVFAGYLFGVQQNIFLDVRELPSLLSRIYDSTIGNEEATSQIVKGMDDTTVAIHNAQVTDQIFFDISIGNSNESKRIVLGLYHDACPKTCENFENLCTGLNLEKQPYKGSTFHRIIPKFMIQGGDWINGDGTGGRSIWSGAKFRDEINGLNLKHSGAGTLSMANSGPNTNSSQFFITLAPTPHLNGKHVVFGKVMSGMEVVREIEECGSRRGKPTKTVKIVNCGLYSRSNHSKRNLNSRSIKWLKNRLNELRRMKKQSSNQKNGIKCITNIIEHEEDMKLLKKLIEDRLKKREERKDASSLKLGE